MPSRLAACVSRRQAPNHNPARDAHERPAHVRREIGPVGTATRLLAGAALVGAIVYGELATVGHLEPLTWLLGFLGFPALVLVWHLWRIRHDPAPFVETSALTFALSLALPLTLYFLGWVVLPLWYTSDATIIFIGGSLLLAGLRGSAGCEFLALSNWVLHRHDQLACAVWTPFDALDQRRPRA
jgi:hypothetical protein